MTAPPHNLDAERSLLSAMLASTGAIATAAELVKASDFYSPNHGHIFDAVLSAGPDTVLVAAELKRANLLDVVGGPAALTTLAAGHGYPKSAERYAREIADHAEARRTLHLTEQLTEAIRAGDGAKADKLRAELAEGRGRGSSGLTLTPASAVRIERAEFAYEGRIPLAGTTLFAGREGLGKTLFNCWTAAELTRGQLPGDLYGQPSAVVMIGSEDDRASVLTPRLIAAGADLDLVQFIDLPAGATFTLTHDLPELEARCVETTRQLGVRMGAVFIDPLDCHLGDRTDSHKKAEVQAAIGHLARLAQRLNCAAIGVAHLNKGDSRDVLTKVVGSVGFTTAVRSVLAIGEHPDDPTERVVVLRKANMTDASKVPAVRFKAEAVQIPHPDPTEPPIDTAAVVITGEEHGLDPNAILGVPDAEERSAVDEAVEWLVDVLRDGPMPSKECKALAREADISEATLKRALKPAGVVVEREQRRGRPSTWRLGPIHVSAPGVSVQALCDPIEPKSEPAPIQGSEPTVSVSAHGSETGENPKTEAVA